MSLYNPFSRRSFPLPSITTIPKLGEGEYLMKNHVYVESAALSSSNMNVSPKDMTVMIVQGGYRRLAFAKPGDLAWQIIDNDECLCYRTACFYKGKFYAAGKNGTVECDISLNPKVILMHLRSWTGLPRYELSRSYLIESQSGDLIMLDRWVEYNEEVELNENIDSPRNPRWTYTTRSFMAYKMNFAARQWSPLESIGDDEVFFVGFNTAFSLKVQTGKGNRVYFTDDFIEGQNSEVMDYGKLYTKDMGVFNFKDRVISPYFDIGDAVLFPPPMWVTPLPW